ncbi:MAG: HlyD family efflux transporter periplasmic adaptor subunit [bacterium]|nr:HlyD family efflux transporter periplasmic adaptor subunit [bacterium]
MAGNKKIVSIKKYRKKENLNIGVILFGVVFLYLVVMIIMYFAKDKTAVYEVREGSILRDNSYTGLILRDETVVYADKDGYVNYFYESGKKVPFGYNVYLLTQDEILNESGEETKNEEVVLNSDNWNRLLMKVQAFNESFNINDFSSAKSLKEETNTILNSNTTQNRVTQLNTILENTQMEYIAYQSDEDGIIAYNIDGYESLTTENLSEKEISKNGYTKVSLVNNTKIKAGDPVYRLVTEKDWTLVIPLTEEMETQFLEQMGEKEYLYVKLRVAKDNEKIGGYLSIEHDKKNNAYGFIHLSDSLVRYVEDRYLDIELILENQSGLKIPKSAVAQKEFYVIPEEYLTNGGSSSSSGVLKENAKNGSIEFVEVNIFSRDIENGTVYVSTQNFKDGDTLIKPESSEKMTLMEKMSLNGVYNVNKGYAVFTQVNILCESEDYYIIEEGTSYGLSNYDHIALDGSMIQDNQIISQ